jgi:uncharacterized membrane protein
MERMESMDALRGLAIIIMFFDHVLFFSPNSSFDPFSPRFFTRIAEPIFAVLVGYFLIGREDKRLFSRLLEILAVAFLVNIFFYMLLGKLDILISLALSYLAYFALKDKIVLLVPAFVLFSLDPTTQLLDYPLSLVLSQVALGAAIRKGLSPLLLFAFLLAPLFVPAPYSYTALFTVAAGCLVLLAQKFKDIKMPVASQIGKRPLLYYMVQYVLAGIVAVLIYK